MAESKSWNWQIVEEDKKSIWKNPSKESYFLVNRWLGQAKKSFLDLGCGLGRHSILFGKNGFDVSCFDLSENALERTRKWAEEEGMRFEYTRGDMLELPYRNESFDCILSMNVISHTDTKGLEQVISEINRVLKPGGEGYITLASKETWSFKQTDWPMVDENTRYRMEEGPEYMIPHVYVDYEMIKRLFAGFEIFGLTQVEDFYEKDGATNSSFHYHILFGKSK